MFAIYVKLLRHPINIEAHPRILAALDEAIGAGAFPGCSLCVTLRDEVVIHGARGRFTYAADSPLVTLETIYDLASLTKVMAATAMAMRLYEGKRLRLEQPLHELVPEFLAGGRGDNDPRRARVTLSMLLAHASGLPGYARLFEQATTREELIVLAARMPLTSEPGRQSEYSDIGFILLGRALERIAGEPLDSFCSREIFAPLGMTKTFFNPAKESCTLIPPTEDDPDFRHRVIQGEVHDENAWVMGGVSAHAGLFATSYDVARFAIAMLKALSPSSGESPRGDGAMPRGSMFRPETASLFTARQSSPPGTSRALGWDTPSAPSQSGHYFSSTSFGHLGFTGTSLWIDPARELSITLLTNRTWPTRRKELIKQARPRIHDAIVESLGPSS